MEKDDKWNNEAGPFSWTIYTFMIDGLAVKHFVYIRCVCNVFSSIFYSTHFPN